MLVQSQSHRGPLAFAPAYDAHSTVVCFWEARICFPKVIYTVSFLHEGLDRMLRRLRAASVYVMYGAVRTYSASFCYGLVT